jgi:hypothetical protein
VKIILQNTQKLLLFSMIIKAESIHKSYQNAKQESFGAETSSLIKR